MLSDFFRCLLKKKKKKEGVGVGGGCAFGTCLQMVVFLFIPCFVYMFIPCNLYSVEFSIETFFFKFCAY